MVQTRFLERGLFIDVYFSILSEDVPSLLSNRDMVYNRLDILLQGRYLHRKSMPTDGPQKLLLRVPLICIQDPYVLYTKQDLGKIDR